MNEQRSVGVTEASIGLTLIIGLLVTFGYVILLRLDDSPRDTLTMPAVSTYGDVADASGEHLRTALGPAPRHPAEHQPSYAPQWLEPQSPQPGDSFTR